MACFCLCLNLFVHSFRFTIFIPGRWVVWTLVSGYICPSLYSICGIYELPAVETLAADQQKPIRCGAALGFLTLNTCKFLYTGLCWTLYCPTATLATVNGFRWKWPTLKPGEALQPAFFLCSLWLRRRRSRSVPTFVERNAPSRPVATKQPHSGAMSLHLKSLVLITVSAKRFLDKIYIKIYYNFHHMVVCAVRIACKRCKSEPKSCWRIASHN